MIFYVPYIQENVVTDPDSAHMISMRLRYNDQVVVTDLVGNSAHVKILDVNKKTKQVNFDIAVAEPEMMKLLPSIARILGVAGVMPNPKTGTVGDDVAKLIEPLVKGKINFKNDKTGNLHLICGKLNADFTTEKLVENINAAIEAVEKSKPEVIKKKFIESAHIATTMSPSIRII